MTPERRGAHPILRFLLWFVAPLDDRLRGLSLTRILAAVCFVFVAHGVWHEQPLSWVDFWVLVLGTCSAYGKKMVNALLLRIGLGTQAVSQEVRSKVDITLHEIQERRASGKEWDCEQS